MAITIKDVEYVAKLARLEFNEAEKEKFTDGFNNILGFVDKLSQVDTDGIEISISSWPIFNALRDDEIKDSMDKDSVLMNAPDEKEGYFKVPKVIE